MRLGARSAPAGTTTRTARRRPRPTAVRSLGSRREREGGRGLPFAPRGRGRGRAAAPARSPRRLCAEALRREGPARLCGDGRVRTPAGGGIAARIGKLRHDRGQPGPIVPGQPRAEEGAEVMRDGNSPQSGRGGEAKPAGRAGETAPLPEAAAPLRYAPMMRCACLASSRPPSRPPLAMEAGRPDR